MIHCLNSVWERERERERDVERKKNSSSLYLSHSNAWMGQCSMVANGGTHCGDGFFDWWVPPKFFSRGFTFASGRARAQSRAPCVANLVSFGDRLMVGWIDFKYHLSVLWQVGGSLWNSNWYIYTVTTTKRFFSVQMGLWAHELSPENDFHLSVITQKWYFLSSYFSPFSITVSHFEGIWR